MYVTIYPCQLNYLMYKLLFSSIMKARHLYIVVIHSQLVTIHLRHLLYYVILQFLQLKRVNCVNCEIRPNRPNGPVGKPRTSTSTCPTKLGPILSHGPPVRTKAQTCPSRFKKLVLQAREACPASLRGLFSRSG